MKFVRLSDSCRDQNLQMVQRDGQIFFVATRAILQRQELRVNYSPEYASERNLPVPETTDNQTGEDESGDLQAAISSQQRAKRSQKSSSEGGSPVRRKIKVLLPERAVSDAANEKFHCHICSKQFSKEISLARFGFCAVVFFYWNVHVCCHINFTDT